MADGRFAPDGGARAEAGPDASDGPRWSAPRPDSVTGLRRWYLIGNALDPGEDQLRLRVDDPAVEELRASLDGSDLGALARDASGHVLEADIGDLPPGIHELALFANDSTTPWTTMTFTRSHPLYVVVSNDWDTSDNADSVISDQAALHTRHPHLVMTHLVGPYTFTDGTLPAERLDAQLAWLERARHDWGDEVGLHIHPYCNFVDVTGVTCRTSPTYATSWRGVGYTVPSTAYEEDEYLAMLRAADALFEAHGLGKPTAFRAGGWAADERILRALATDGFLVDSSACNWRRMEEWRDVPGASLYPLAMSLWGPIDDVSQPYYPGEHDAARDAAPHLSILELPDNGILADYVSADEMIEILRSLWDGGALDEPRALSIGYHPASLDASTWTRLDDTFDRIDASLAVEDAGPVVYARMSDMTRVWPPI